MTAILVTIPERSWIEWLDARNAAPTAPWFYSMTDKPPPVKAGDAIYVCALGRVRGYAVALRDVELGERLASTTSWGRRRQPWSIKMGAFVEVPPQERIAVRSLQTWRHWPIRAA